MQNKERFNLPGANLEEISRFVTLGVSEIFDDVISILQQELVAVSNLRFKFKNHQINQRDFEALRYESLQKAHIICLKNNKILSELINCAEYIVSKMTALETIDSNLYKFFIKNIFKKNFHGDKVKKRRLNLLEAIIVLDGIEYDKYKDLDFFALKKVSLLTLSSKHKIADIDINFLMLYEKRIRFDVFSNFKTIVQKISNKSRRSLDKIINLSDDEGNTPLHYCSMTSSVELCKLLIQKGAHKTVCNKNMLNPMKIALENYNLRAVNMFLDYDINVTTNDKIRFKHIFDELV